MKITLINCDLDVHYIGTREDIACQMVIDAMNELSESLAEFGRSATQAVKIMMEDALLLYSDYLKFGRSI